MALSNEEQKQLDALTAKSQESDEEDYEIDIWDESGKGARLPYSKGKSWLQHFGIDVPEPTGNESDDDGNSDGTPDDKRPGKARKPATNQGTAQRYFGKRAAR